MENTGKGLLDFIAAGEGGYNSSNRGTLNKKILGSTHDTQRDGKPLTEMTIAEIQAKQAISDPNDEDRLFAVGRYQLIPETFNMAVEGLGLDTQATLSEGIQDQLGTWLMKKKRPKLGAYLDGESDDRDAALLELSKEWASIPVAKDTKVGNKIIRKGNSYYGNGNKAQHSVEQVEQALDSARLLVTNPVLEEAPEQVEEQPTYSQYRSKAMAAAHSGDKDQAKAILREAKSMGLSPSAEDKESFEVFSRKPLER